MVTTLSRSPGGQSRAPASLRLSSFDSSRARIAGKISPSHASISLAALLLLASACGDDDSSGWGSPDAGDARSPVVGGEDASDADARAPDAEAIDEAPKDAGAPIDAGTPQDAGALDAMVEPDASTSDAGVEPMMCLAATEACDQATQCCGELSCDTTSLGKVCCGEEGATCATANGEDCCRDLLCIAGRCGYRLEDSCSSPCTAAPALTLERQRLMAIGGSFLGICGDANHDYGFHVAPANLPASDYSLEGAVNQPVCQWHAAAIDIGMDWPASRDWLRWLIEGIRADTIKGIAEVIGSYDGQNVRYWSDSSGWGTDGEAYTGTGHDTWTHVAVYRSTTLEDHHILDGWTATSGP